MDNLVLREGPKAFENQNATEKRERLKQNLIFVLFVFDRYCCYSMVEARGRENPEHRAGVWKPSLNCEDTKAKTIPKKKGTEDMFGID